MDTHDFAHLGLTRRDIISGAAAAGLSAATASIPLGSAVAGPEPSRTVSGVVFEDGSGTGRYRPGDRGIPGVLVSDGCNVVKTDEEGRYTLPIEDESIIFVVKPTGYAVPVDETMLPRFYYIHQPSGSPQHLGLRFRGIDPTGPLPASVDFALRRTEEPAAFDVILFTDPQPESHVELDFVRDDVINGVIGTNAKFGITMGDIMFDNLSLYPRHNRIIAQIGIPWYNVGGNHDLNFEAPDRHYSRETFKRVFGPSCYAFEYGQVLFVMLDNVDYLGADPTKPNLNGKYQGRIGERQLAFVAAVLKEFPPDRLVVVGMHIPLRTYLGVDDTWQNTIDRGDFLKLLADRANAVSFAGHTHTTEHHYLGANDGYAGQTPHHHHVLTAVSGSWWSGPFDHRGVAVADSRDGTPNGFHVLSIDGNRYTTRFVPANEPGNRQMRIMIESEFHRADKEIYGEFRMGSLLGSPIPVESAYSSSVVVNVFDGGPRTVVEYQLGGGPAVTMQRLARIDPFVHEEFSRNEAIKKPWVKAELSSHVFVARLPADLDAGTHTVHVRAIDEYGREHRDHLVIEVTGQGNPPRG